MRPTGEDAPEPAAAGPEPAGTDLLSSWRRRWELDLPLAAAPRRAGVLGTIAAVARKALAPLMRVVQKESLERQRTYNLVVLDHLERLARIEEETKAENRQRAESLATLAAALDRLGQDLQSVQRELFNDIETTRTANERDVQSLKQDHWRYLKSHDERVSVLESLRDEGWNDVKVHSQALFSRLDQKLDRYRLLAQDRWSRLGALLEVARRDGVEGLTRAVDEEQYVEFEGRFRGEERDIADRLESYLEILAGRGEVLDLGCGRGEALEVFSARGIPCRGVDSSSEMVDRCRAKGLRAEVGDLMEVLAATEAESLGAVVSFHVVEHLPARAVERLVRLAWRALAPNGVLVLETPSPLSLVVGARNFWIDPTHLRPLHPASLAAILELNGFDPVERIDLQPFSASDRLPDPELSDLPSELRPLGRAVTELRDHLDRLLYGYQDFALVGYKPSSGAPVAGGRR